MSKHLVFTGTKEEPTQCQMVALFDTITTAIEDGFTIMHNGDCKGSDAWAAHIWKNIKRQTLILHPPTDPKYRAWIKYADTVMPEGDYIKRDHDMVNLSSMLIGISKTPAEYLRSGTWATIRYARKIGIPRHIIYPDGRVDFEPGTSLAGLL